MQVLIVEDDATIRALITTALQREGHCCFSASDGREGAELLETGHYDLVLLDLMLPEINGYELLEYMRSNEPDPNAATPVIILSAMGSVQDRIRGLRMGADDYLCKPFQVGELLARVDAVFRRAGVKQTVFSVGDVVVDTEARTVLKNGEDIPLTVKEFDLLVLLMQRKNVALSRSLLYESVWQEEYTGETRTLDNHIQRLRKKLGWEDRITTVFRIGYRFRP